MSEELRENLAASLQKLLPLLTSIILVLMSYVPLNFAAANNLRPAVGLMCVFFWMLHRPDVFNLFSVYFLGLVEDIVTSGTFRRQYFCLSDYVFAGEQSGGLFERQTFCGYLVRFCRVLPDYDVQPLAVGFGLLQPVSAAVDVDVQPLVYNRFLSGYRLSQRFCAEQADERRGLR